MYELLKILNQLENVKEAVSNDLSSGEFKGNEAHLKGMIAGLELAIKTVKFEMEVE